MQPRYCNWETELEIIVKSMDERSEVESFIISGRAAEVPTPRVGDIVRFLEHDEGRSATKIVRVHFMGHEINRRSNPWIWKQKWRVMTRVVDESRMGYDAFG